MRDRFHAGIPRYEPLPRTTGSANWDRRTLPTRTRSDALRRFLRLDQRAVALEVNRCDVVCATALRGVRGGDHGRDAAARALERYWILQIGDNAFRSQSDRWLSHERTHRLAARQQFVDDQATQQPGSTHDQ